MAARIERVDENPTADSPGEDEGPRGTLSPEDRGIVESLRAGDESAFAALVERYTPALTRVAFSYTRDREAAHDVVQETWLGVLGAITRFEGRSSLKTWLFRILVKRALTRAGKDARTRPFSALAARDAAGDEPAVDPDRFIPAGRPGAGGWASMGVDWDSYPPERLLAQETMAVVRRAIADLPESQATVITLRDIEQWTSTEVCNALGISETNQRVLLHRARARVRAAVARHLEEGSA